MKNLPFSVVYEDEKIIAVSKQAGIAVSADRWDDSEERLDKLITDPLPPGSRLFRVHRIDKDTSGLVVFAKNENSHARLSLAFEGRQIEKRYIAIVHGRPLWKESSCDLPLVPNGNKRHMTIIDKYRGKKSLTLFCLLGSAGNYSVLEARPETGRTHQIRVHAASLDFPIVCDPLYGNNRPVLLSSFKRNWRGDPREEKPLLARLGLHAADLFIPGGALAKPDASPEALRLHAALARDMAALIRQMEKHSGAAIMDRTEIEVYNTEPTITTGQSPNLTDETAEALAIS
jgi:23S rRNA pseudouridine1911/1915/1917 synthase